MNFEGSESDWFKWLYIDTKKLTEVANSTKLKTVIILQGGDYNYLAKLTLK